MDDLRCAKEEVLTEPDDGMDVEENRKFKVNM